MGVNVGIGVKVLVGVTVGVLVTFGVSVGTGMTAVLKTPQARRTGRSKRTQKEDNRIVERGRGIRSNGGMGYIQEESQGLVEHSFFYNRVSIYFVPLRSSSDTNLDAPKV